MAGIALALLPWWDWLLIGWAVLVLIVVAWLVYGVEHVPFDES